jgi:hypothetical protein
VKSKRLIDVLDPTPAGNAFKDPARAPHRALRRLVRREGDDAPRALYQAFALFNALFFAGDLQTPLLMLAQTSSPRALGTYTPRDVHGLESVIRIAPSTLKRGWRLTLATLLHEMIHQWAHEMDGDSEPVYRGHGPKFAAKANAIGAVLGFPECSPKGRGGKARADAWPELPPGDDDSATKVKPAAAAGEGDGEGDDGGRQEHDTAAAEQRGARREREAVVQWLTHVQGHWQQAKLKVPSAQLGIIVEDIAQGAHRHELEHVGAAVDPYVQLPAAVVEALDALARERGEGRTDALVAALRVGIRALDSDAPHVPIKRDAAVRPPSRRRSA